MIRRIVFGLTLVMGAWACSSDDSPGSGSDGFDRSALLINWADNIIIPAYEAYAASLAKLTTAENQFTINLSVQNLEELRTAWLEAYIAWQHVSMFEIGKAEELTLRDFTNIFPANAAEIESSISSGVPPFNLELPSSRDEQGFPALDYLLFGIADNDEDIVDQFRQDAKYGIYLSQVVTRLNSLTNEVLDDWKDEFRDEFVENNGSTAGSSVNKLVNDYMFYYEKALRAGKIGIPAGVFSTSPLSDRVEGLYSKKYSKVLFEAALQATIDFFNGKHFDGAGTGPGLNTYLAFLNTITEGENLATAINSQFTKAQSTSGLLKDSFFDEVETNNTAMLGAYNELQAVVPLMKVDMFTALNIRVDFVDADGD
ncbi:imelysin family protein [Fulvivirga sp. M361]|uniref:imelysin family protein n=1 Tax=Fulvivirga sp. M361 TaxID=2594266 RepID=UPI00210250C7|nr:imelysin family protein [Fulvivirga sp. M361]